MRAPTWPNLDVAVAGTDGLVALLEVSLEYECAEYGLMLVALLLLDLSNGGIHHLLLILADARFCR